MVDAKLVYSVALKCNASSIIVAHNHPSGNPEPSDEDIAVTKQLIEAGEIMGVEILDHIILGVNKFISLREKGYV